MYKQSKRRCKGDETMLEILVLILVAVLLCLTAIVAFAAGATYAAKNVIEKLKAEGWAIEPPHKE